MRNTESLKKFERKLQLWNYSPRTIQTYSAALRQMFRYLDKDSYRISNQDIERYFEYKILQCKGSRAMHDQLINAVVKYFQIIHNRKLNELVIKRPRKEKRQVVVLTKNEISKILSKIDNKKHHAVINTIYSLGLRISEVINLSIDDIDSYAMVVYIRQAKGAKDRQVPLPEYLLYELREYYKQYRPKYYLFEGQTGDKYSTTSISNILKRAVLKSKINKQVSVHTLRHSYATHLMNANVNHQLISEILGHKNIKTTMRYSHVTTESYNVIDFNNALSNSNNLKIA